MEELKKLADQLAKMRECSLENLEQVARIAQEAKNHIGPNQVTELGNQAYGLVLTALDMIPKVRNYIENEGQVAAVIPFSDVVNTLEAAVSFMLPEEEQA